ncbi:uncharacterized protein G2W53_038694 [Senna tora]|uniref:Uncharacterized protein n=1 Tax=Senna tora TaxID=362788 RepID=A0A834SPG9_9FABA|nr:uncharacterized protein G2W53_038694 [Senna tora]
MRGSEVEREGQRMVGKDGASTNCYILASTRT